MASELSPVDRIFLERLSQLATANPFLPERIDLDDVAKIPRLRDIAERVMLEPTLDWLQPEREPFGALRSSTWF